MHGNPRLNAVESAGGEEKKKTRMSMVLTVTDAQSYSVTQNLQNDIRSNCCHWLALDLTLLCKWQTKDQGVLGKAQCHRARAQKILYCNDQTRAGPMCCLTRAGLLTWRASSSSHSLLIEHLTSHLEMNRSGSVRQ